MKQTKLTKTAGYYGYAATLVSCTTSPRPHEEEPLCGSKLVEIFAGYPRFYLILAHSNTISLL